MSKEGEQDQEHGDVPIGSQFTSMNTGMRRDLSPSSQFAHAAGSPGQSDQLRRILHDATTSSQQLRVPGAPVIPNRDSPSTNLTPAMPMPPYPGTDTLWNFAPSPSLSTHQGVTQGAQPTVDEKATRINAWLENVVDQDLFTADAVLGPSLEAQLARRTAMPAPGQAGSHPSAGVSLRPSPDRQYLSPYLGPSPARPFEAQLAAHPVNPPSQSKSQASDFGFMTQPFPTIPSTQVPLNPPRITRARSGAVTGTGPPPMLPSTGVEGLSPHVTPYRKHSRPRRPRFPSYYDEDIIRTDSDKDKEKDTKN